MAAPLTILNPERCRALAEALDAFERLAGDDPAARRDVDDVRAAALRLALRRGWVRGERVAGGEEG